MGDAQSSESEKGLGWGTDGLGVYAHVRVDPAIYNELAVLKTAYWFTDRFYVYLSKQADSTILIELRPKTTGSEQDLVSACREFCNSLLDHSVRQQVIRETSAVRDSLIRKAFFEGSNPEAALKARGNESYVPGDGQTYRDDPLAIRQRSE